MASSCATVTRKRFIPFSSSSGMVPPPASASTVKRWKAPASRCLMIAGRTGSRYAWRLNNKKKVIHMNKFDGKARSDALVVFGATGDLAYKKIFPALYALAKRGLLNMPVIGVSGSDWDDAPVRQRQHRRRRQGR